MNSFDIGLEYFKTSDILQISTYGEGKVKQYHNIRTMDDVNAAVNDYLGERESRAKVLIAFMGGTSRNSNAGCNYMIGHYYDDDGDRQELYAEVLVPKEINWPECEDYGRNELMDEIIRQAKEAGFSEDQLIFQ